MKLMIVDDDDQIREGMVYGIQWENLGIDRVEGRKNGKEVLDALKEDVWDIIISDISMPVMSGIDLMRTVHETHPEIHFILISGYREFEYAQAGIQCGADAYILKPIHINELLDTVSDVLDKISQTHKNAENQNYVDAAGKNQEVRRLVRMKTCSAEQVTDFLIHRCDFKRIHALVAMVLQDDEKTDAMGLNPACRQVVIHTITECLAGYTYAFFFMDSNEVFLLVNVADSAMLIMHLKQQMRRLQLEINENLDGESISAGISGVGYAADFTRIYEQAKDVLNECFFLGKAICMDVQECITRKDKVSVEQEKEWTEQVIQAIDQTNMQVLEQVMEVCGKSLQKYSKDAAEDFLQHCSAEVFRKFGISFQENDLQKRIYEAKDFGELYREWTQVMGKVLKDRLEDTKYSREISSALRYIREHYMEKISAEEIAEELQISSGHFSRTFKQQVGISFVRYLNQYRIDKAQELLQTTNLRVYEVAEQVGISDYMYFTQVFRNITGKSPKDFRK